MSILNYYANEVKYLRASLEQLQKQTNSIIRKEIDNNGIEPQSNVMHGTHLGLCISTVDPWGENRIKFWCPLLHADETDVQSLPYAKALQPLGGFDACGTTWVPPAGSTVALQFLNGSRDAAVYLGTVSTRDRGPDGQHNWQKKIAIDEYNKLHEGKRKFYLIGANDGSQVLPPWNTDNSGIKDIDDPTSTDDSPDAQNNAIPAHMYGFLTPQGMGLKMDDGNYKCNHKHKRLELYSNFNYIIFKDDFLHNSGTWGNQDCLEAPGEDLSKCLDDDGQPVEKTTCDGEKTNPTIQGGHPSTPYDNESVYDLTTNKGYNPYFKYKNECRPIKGPGTKQNNKLELPQSGWQIGSRSGMVFLADDSVEEPRGVPDREQATKDFDYGCNDKFLGKMLARSAHGHEICLNDMESDTNIRGEENGIKLKTSNGTSLFLGDHTVGAENAEECPPLVGGKRRGLFVQTSSNHIFEMSDEENEQCAKPRQAGGIPINKAKKARIRLRSGYGGEICINDYEPGSAEDGSEDKIGSQEKTINQSIQILSPQVTNQERGPHILRFQEKADGPGQVLLRVGGDFICSVNDAAAVVVGKDLAANIKGNTIINTEKNYINAANIHQFVAKETIMLLAGNDCSDDENNCGPCAWPVLCLSPKGVTISDRVYVSASPQAQTASIFHMTPFHSSPGFKGC